MQHLDRLRCEKAGCYPPSECVTCSTKRKEDNLGTGISNEAPISPYKMFTGFCAYKRSRNPRRLPPVSVGDALFAGGGNIVRAPACSKISFARGSLHRRLPDRSFEQPRLRQPQKQYSKKFHLPCRFCPIIISCRIMVPISSIERHAYAAGHGVVPT